MENTLETDKKFLFKSTLYNFLGTALKVVAPALMIVVARTFGKEAFGIFVSTQLLMQTLSRASVFGLPAGLNWFLPQNNVNNRPAHLGFNQSLSRSLIVSIIVSAILLVCAAFGLHKYFDSLASLSSRELSIYTLSIVPFAIMVIFGGAAEGIRKPQYRMFINDCMVYAFAPLIALIFYFTDIPYALAIGLLIANILGCFLYIPLIRKALPVSLNFKDKIPRELLIYSIPRGFSDVVGSILSRIDLWMILLLLGSGEAGVYAVMVTISNGLRTIRQSYGPILLPVVAGMSRDRLGTDLKPIFSYCVNMVTLIQLAIGFFIVLFPEQILMIAGKDFIVQPETLGILLFAHLFGGFFSLSATVLNGIGKSLYTLKMDIASLGVAFLVNYFLIPILGLPGAALSSFAVILLQSIWNNVYIFKLNLRLYSKKIIPSAVWSVLLLVLYILLPGFSPELWQKIVFYIAAACGLVATWRLSIVNAD
ncbi:MAG: oligosaccharide flippase family protein [Fibromonadaceae bacterium]|jgi:O-antigen/teichoic acid export membrane protein|nr:oligosaccharide flippase family protein [Fibromonadaceae bacterium]